MARELALVGITPPHMTSESLNHDRTAQMDLTDDAALSIAVSPLHVRRTGRFNKNVAGTVSPTERSGNPG